MSNKINPMNNGKFDFSGGSAPDLSGYIKKDGTTTTTAEIPFAEGIRLATLKPIDFPYVGSIFSQSGTGGINIRAEDTVFSEPRNLNLYTSNDLYTQAVGVSNTEIGGDSYLYIVGSEEITVEGSRTVSVGGEFTLSSASLASAGFVKRDSGGVLSIDTSTYLTSADLSGYAKLDGSNQPFTGNLNISKATPEYRLTDTGNSLYSRFTRDSSNNFRAYSQASYTTGQYALNFAGTTHKVDTGSPIITGTGDFTITAWIKLDALGNTNNIAGNYGSGNTSGVELYIRNTNVLALYLGSTLSATTTLTTGVWYHVAVTRTAGVVDLFLNAVSDVTPATRSGSIGNLRNFTIGNGPDYTSERFRGSIDQVLLFGRALSGSELADIYNAGAGTAFVDSGVSATGLLGIWEMTEGSGTFLTDTSGNGNNGTITDATWVTGKVAGDTFTNEYNYLTLKNSSTTSGADLEIGQNLLNLKYYAANHHFSGDVGVGKIPTERLTIRDAVDAGDVSARIVNSTTTAGSTASLKFTVTSAETYNVAELVATRVPNTLQVKTDSGVRATFGGADLTLTTPLYLPNGSAAAPALAGANDTNTGIYWSGADDLLFTTAGTARMSFNNVGTAAFIPNGTQTLNVSSTGVGIGGLYSGYAGQFNVQNVSSAAASKVTAIIKQQTSQTGALTQWQNSSGSILTYVSSAGAVNIVNGNTVSSSFLNSLTTPDFFVAKESSVSNAAVGVASATASEAPTWLGIRSRSTLASPGAVVDGDSIFRFIGAGYDGTNQITSSAIITSVDGTVSTGVVPQKIGFFTSTTDGAGRTERLTIKAGGKVGVNATSPSAQFHVIATTEQVRIGYDTSNYFSATAGSTGAVTFDAVGSGSSFAFSDSVTVNAQTNTQNIYPVTDDTYYLGKNDDDTPKSWKGVILKDQSTGTYYRLEISGGTILLTDLTD